MPFLAETSEMMVSPPKSSATSLYLVSSCLTRSGRAPGRSILLMATMIGTLAARAWSMASMVCGMIRSSAATTRTTMSVTWAPRARIEVKASWPGVSRNAIDLPCTVTAYAPMCWVMPPVSPPATLVRRM